MPLPLFVASRTFDPRRIPGLAAWYDAADSASVTLDAGRVSQWSDKSGNGRHATNTTSGSTQPSYTTAGRNGLNVLTFAAASVQRLTVASSTAAFNFLHNGTESYVAAVSKYGTSSDPASLYSLFGNAAIASANVGISVCYDDRNNIGQTDASTIVVCNGTVGQFVANTFNATNNGVVADYNSIFTPQAFQAQEYVFFGSAASAANRLRVRIDGGTEKANNNKANTASTANASFNMQIGCGGNNASPLQGDICELMFFNQLPTSAARDLIRRYLGAKWGVAVA